METLRNFLLISAILVFIFVFYRWILRMMRNRELVRKPYPYVHPFPSRDLCRRVVVSVEMPTSAALRVEMRHVADGPTAVIFESSLDQGEVNVDLNLEKVPPGEYTLVLIFPDLVVRRFVRVTEAADIESRRTS